MCGSRVDAIPHPGAMAKYRSAALRICALHIGRVFPVYRFAALVEVTRRTRLKRLPGMRNCGVV